MASRVTKFSKTIIPMADRVLVQRIKPIQDGKVIASELKEGDTVLLPPYGGSIVKVDNEELILFRDSEILAKIQ
ncbi:10 kDa heat shock protein [Podila humilis]|nr:10 kDa heat shock protein [Podila humilis]